MATKKSGFPPGWNAARVQDLVDYYDHQTDEEAAAEHEAALSRPVSRESRQFDPSTKQWRQVAGPKNRLLGEMHRPRATRPRAAAR